MGKPTDTTPAPVLTVKDRQDLVEAKVDASAAIFAGVDLDDLKAASRGLRADKIKNKREVYKVNMPSDDVLWETFSQVVKQYPYRILMHLMPLHERSEAIYRIIELHKAQGGGLSQEQILAVIDKDYEDKVDEYFTSTTRASYREYLLDMGLEEEDLDEAVEEIEDIEGPVLEWHVKKVVQDINRMKTATASYEAHSEMDSDATGHDSSEAISDKHLDPADEWTFEEIEEATAVAVDGEGEDATEATELMTEVERDDDLLEDVDAAFEEAAEEEDHRVQVTAPTEKTAAEAFAEAVKYFYDEPAPYLEAPAAIDEAHTEAEVQKRVKNRLDLQAAADNLVKAFGDVRDMFAKAQDADVEQFSPQKNLRKAEKAVSQVNKTEHTEVPTSFGQKTRARQNFLRMGRVRQKLKVWEAAYEKRYKKLYDKLRDTEKKSESLEVLQEKLDSTARMLEGLRDKRRSAYDLLETTNPHVAFLSPLEGESSLPSAASVTYVDRGMVIDEYARQTSVRLEQAEIAQLQSQSALATQQGLTALEEKVVDTMLDLLKAWDYRDVAADSHVINIETQDVRLAEIAVLTVLAEGIDAGRIKVHNEEIDVIRIAEGAKDKDSLMRAQYLRVKGAVDEKDTLAKETRKLQKLVDEGLGQLPDVPEFNGSGSTPMP